MSLTETKIANMAADFLDVDPIGKLATDMSGMGKAFRRNYQESAKTVLVEFTWNDAKTKTKLVKKVVSSSWPPDPTDFQNALILPFDFLRAIDINGRPIVEINHEIETISEFDGNGLLISRTKVLLCDETVDVNLRYIALIAPADMGPHLAKAVALELAMRCVMKAANSTAKMTKLEQLYQAATRGNVGRIGGHQVASRENNSKPRRDYLGTSGRARAGII